MTLPRHFLDLDALDGGTLRSILDLARELKGDGAGPARPRFAGQAVVMIFDRPSTRTRVSFELAVKSLAGQEAAK